MEQRPYCHIFSGATREELLKEITFSKNAHGDCAVGDTLVLCQNAREGGEGGEICGFAAHIERIARLGSICKAQLGYACQVSPIGLGSGMDKVLTAIFDALEKQGLTAAAASKAAVDNASLIKNMSNARGKNPRYSYQALDKLAEVLNLELYFGPKRPIVAAGDIGNQSIASDQTLPHHGMATCSTQGWADDDILREPIPRPTWVADDSAFWVSTTGTSMVQEGIRAGDFCIISPGRAPRVGDRVWMKEASSDGRIAIKRLTRLTADRAFLRGWLPALKGVQNSFDEERPLAGLAAMHPVLGVYRGQFGKKGVDVEYVHDPRKGSDARQDGLVPVALLDAERSGKGFPVAMGFSDVWLSTLGLKFDQVALIGMSDDHMSPAIPKGAVTLADLSKRKIEGKGIYAIRKGGSVQVRRLELIGETLLITGDSDNSESVLIPKPQRGTVEVLGRVVWSGSAVSIEK